MKIAIGNDHAGYELKLAMKVWLNEHGYEVKDFGTGSTDSVDYPDYAHMVAEAVEKGEFERGVLICGSGLGVSMTANKHQGIRAALCWIPEIAELARLHNNANILCMAGRFIEKEVAVQIMEKFFSTPFEGGRHQNRVDKIPLK